MVSDGREQRRLAVTHWPLLSKPPGSPDPERGLIQTPFPSPHRSHGWIPALADLHPLSLLTQSAGGGGGVVGIHRGVGPPQEMESL